jgi:putative spermidine/putrescine transport system permease protein
MRGRFNRILAVVSYATALLCFSPFVLVLMVATTNNWREGVWANGISLEWLLAAWERLTPRVIFSVQLALLILFLNALIGLPAAWALARFDFPGKNFIRSLSVLPLSIPGIAIALALILAYPTAKASGFLLVVGHLLYTLPFFIAALTPPLANDRILAQEEVARTLGTSFIRRFLLVTLPNIKTALLAAAILCFTLSMGEFNVSFFLFTPLYKTLPIDLYDIYVTGRLELAAAMTIIFLLFVVPASLLLEQLGSKTVGGV